MTFRYENLEVGLDILKFIDTVYELSTNFPLDERFGLTSQARRAVTSIYLNLVEGTARRTSAEFSRFITMSLGSNVEVHAIFKLALRRKYITESEWNNIEGDAEKIWKRLCALRNSQTN